MCDCNNDKDIFIKYFALSGLVWLVNLSTQRLHVGLG